MIFDEPLCLPGATLQFQKHLPELDARASKIVSLAMIASLTDRNRSAVFGTFRAWFTSSLLVFFDY